jgi:hypothetical protein
MTTRVHVVNLGHWPVEVSAVNPTTQEVNGTKKVIYPGDAVNEYVYDTQIVQVKEVDLSKV